MRLPPAFHDCSCGWQISASAGFKDGFRLRTWHWLSHPVTGEELRFWCKPAIDRGLLDQSTLIEAQPIYIGVHVIGGPDPCPVRFGIRTKAKDVVPVPDLAGMKRRLEEAEATKRRVKTAMRHNISPRYAVRPTVGAQYQPNPERDRRFAEGVIDKCIAKIRSSHPGNRTPTYNEEAARAKWACDQFDVPWQPVRDELKSAFAGTLSAGEQHREEKNGEGVLIWLEKRARV